MADSPNVLSSLNGIAKEVYADGVKQLVPDGCKVQKQINFSAKEKSLGGYYHQPVLLAYEHGFTFAASGAGAFNLNDSVASVMKDAQVQGSQILLKSQIDYELAARAAKGKNAFVDATSLVIESMQKSMRKRLEVQLMYGSSGIATVASLSSQVITITTAEFAAGIWAGMEGATIDVYQAATSTPRQSGLVVSSVDLDARTVTVTGTTTGIVSGDTIYYGGAYGKEMAGIHKVLTNTGSLFNIDAAAYTLWKSTSYGAGSAALTQAKVGAAVAQAVGKGLDNDLLLLVNPKTWNNLLTDQAALVRNRGSEIKSVVSNGSSNIELYSQNGKITIEPSIYVKEGHAFGLSPENWKRIGAVDVSFKTPGYGEDMFLQMPTKAGFELRAYTNQAVFCEAPAKNLIITAITNS